MKLRILLAAVSFIVLLIAAAAAVHAQDEVPDPYRGLTNPFPWNDVSAQEEGKGIYKSYCLGCHGPGGSNLPDSDFSAQDFPQSLEENSDFFFWTLSDGMLDKGMPPYKSSLSEDQRWQVLTYLWTLGASVPSETPPGEPPVDTGNATLFLYAVGKAQTGEPLTLMASLEDGQKQPIQNATVQFLIEADFFARGLMEIGEALTDDQRVATLEYTRRQGGVTAVVVRYGGNVPDPVEYKMTLTFAGQDVPFYWPEAGIHLPAPGNEVFFGPDSARELDELGSAPMSAFRLPGGVLSWLLLFVAVVLSIWIAYFFVLFQAFRIPVVKNVRDSELRLVPMLGMAIVVFTGIALALMSLIGPNSHMHLH